MGPDIAHVRSADGTSIAWAATGAGPTLIHLPGVPFSNLEAEWRIPALQRAFGLLARHVRFVQFDGRGTGRSQRHVTDLSLEAHLADLTAVVDATGAERVVLLGFYHSATHAIAYAARHPSRVRGMVLFGGSTRGAAPMSGAATEALLSLIERDWDTFAESAAHAWLGWPADMEGRLAAEWFRTATSPSNARATLEAAAGVDVTADAARVGCPVLVLHREHAPVIPLALTESLVAALPTARLSIVPGTSASLFFEAADEVVARLIAFVQHPERVAAPQRSARSVAGPDGLTGRELEVLRLIAAGESNGQIAAALGLSINTVERHAANLYRRIDVRSRAEATAWAIRRGLA